MNLKPIDKPLYRKRLNLVIVAFILSFGFFAVSFGQILIHFFGDIAITSVAIETGEQPNNFKLNLLGVMLGLLIASFILSRLRHTDFFYEIYYVWQLKQLHNRIYRKLTKIKALAKLNNVDAYIVLAFYYQSLKVVYELDDNTLVISKVNSDILTLEQSIKEADLKVELQQFSEALLASVEKQLPELKLI